jgi:hypothetical protein
LNAVFTFRNISALLKKTISFSILSAFLLKKGFIFNFCFVWSRYYKVHHSSFYAVVVGTRADRTSVTFSEKRIPIKNPEKYLKKAKKEEKPMREAAFVQFYPPL